MDGCACAVRASALSTAPAISARAVGAGAHRIRHAQSEPIGVYCACRTCASPVRASSVLASALRQPGGRSFDSAEASAASAPMHLQPGIPERRHTVPQPEEGRSGAASDVPGDTNVLGPAQATSTEMHAIQSIQLKRSAPMRQRRTEPAFAFSGLGAEPCTLEGEHGIRKRWKSEKAEQDRLLGWALMLVTFSV